VLGSDTADLLDLLPGLAGDDVPARPEGRPATVGDLLDRVVAMRPDAEARLAAAGALAGTELTVAGTAAAAALDLTAWPDTDTVTRELADPVAASRTVAVLGDRVLGAAGDAAAAAGRADVLWLFALAPRPVPFYVRMGDALAADPSAEERLDAMVRAMRENLTDTATAGHTDGAAAAAQLLHRVPALTVRRNTIDALVDLLVAARRRGTAGRGVVDAAVGLLARLRREPDPPAPADDPSLVARTRQRQARIDGIRAAVALLSELQSYPPVALDPRGIWDDLVTVAREHGLEPVGARGVEAAYDPHLHEVLDDDDANDEFPEDGDDPADRTIRVVRSGYTWAHGGEVVVLQRALVRAVDPD
jgi:hypothetical protein